jgi:2-isopropylmalate synthase
MKKIKIFDTTLRDGEQAPGCSMDFNEKLEVAKQLEKLKVDVIEAGFPIASPGDFESVKAIAGVVKDCIVCGLARATKKDIDAVYQAVRKAAAPRIHTFIATSPVHMKYKLKMEPEEVLRQAGEMVAYAKSLCPDVEFSAEDAIRSDPEFLVHVLENAIAKGANVINIPDTVGYTTPEEMAALIAYVRDHAKGIEKAEISVHCHNDLGMAVANSLAAVTAGAVQIECAINGLGERAGNAALEEVVMGLHTRRQYFQAECRINTSQLYSVSRLVQNITGIQVPPNKAVIGANAFAHESGIHQHGVMAERTTYEIMTPESVGIPRNFMVLGKHSGRHAFAERLKDLGYALSDAELDKAFEQFKALTDKKKNILDRDLEAIVSDRVLEVPERYALTRFIINSGNTIPATATVALRCGDDEVEDVSMGDGPVDAAFKAINNMLKREFVLGDYSLRSVTEGQDALGEAVVKLSYENIAVTGRGLSTDIIESSIKAYINGVNKILAQEELKGADEVEPTGSGI